MITIPMLGRKHISGKERPLFAQSINIVEEVEDDEEEAFLQANPTIVSVFEVDVEGILQKDEEPEKIGVEPVLG